jgi:cell division protein FtsB
LTLGDTSLTFIDGAWETGARAVTSAARPRTPGPGEVVKQQAEVSKLQKENESLQSEVNLLKFKVQPAHHLARG